MPLEVEKEESYGLLVCTICNRDRTEGPVGIREAYVCDPCDDGQTSLQHTKMGQTVLEQLKGMESVAKGDFTETVGRYDLEFDQAFGSLEMYPDAYGDSSVNYSFGYLMAIQAVISVVKTENK